MELLPEIIKVTQDNLPLLITLGLSITSVVLGSKYKKFKARFVAIIDILDAILEAIADETVTLDEVQNIILTIKRLDELDNQ